MNCEKHDFEWDISDPMGCPVCYGETLAEARIIKLLRDDNRLHNTSFEEVIVSKGEQRKFEEVCVPFCPGCEAIALIKESDESQT